MNGQPANELVESAPLPEGARDVLPIEAAELTAIENSLRTTFAAFGYREVRTPLLEYAEVMDRAQDGGLGRAFRLFDDHGQVLVVRPDLTIPVARLVAGRLGAHPGPIRLSYVSESVRPAPPGKAQRVEERQGGIELIGLPGPAADAEVVAMLVTGLTGLGIDDLRVAVGDASLTRAVLDGVGVSDADQLRLRDAVRRRNLIAWRRTAEALELDAQARRVVADLPSVRGGADVLRALAERVPGAAPECEALLATLALLDDHDIASHVMIDLGVLHDWGYYSGIVFEAYAPKVGRPIAVGGRYDGLIGRFGIARPAVGAAIRLDHLHEAIAARNGRSTDAHGVILVGGIGSQLAAARALRAAGVPVIGVPDDPAAADALALAEGVRFVVQRTATEYHVRDRASQRTIQCADAEEVARSLRS